MMISLNIVLLSYTLSRNGVANIYDQQVAIGFFPNVSSANSQLTASVSQGLAETFQNEPDLTHESLFFLIK